MNDLGFITFLLYFKQGMVGSPSLAALLEIHQCRFQWQLLRCAMYLISIKYKWLQSVDLAFVKTILVILLILVGWLFWA